MKLKNILIFSLGIGIGSAVTYKILSDKYEQRIQEEIDSVKEVFGRNRKIEDKEVIEIKEELPKNAEIVSGDKNKEKKDYANMIAYHKYGAHDEEDNESENEYPVEENIVELIEPEDSTLANKMGNIYVIPPEEFGLIDHDLITLTYYADGVLTDDMDEIVDDVEEKITSDYHKHFGEYEPDAVYVRNDILKVDYEILKDVRNYSDVVWGNRPPHYQ